MTAAEYSASKVPEVTLVFWIMKIAATTLGETGGDTVTMTLNWGYVAGVELFGVASLGCVHRRGGAQLLGDLGDRLAEFFDGGGDGLHIVRLCRPFPESVIRAAR